MAIDKILLERLKSIRAKDIDPLVDIITDYGKGRAALNSNIKKSLLKERNSLSPNRYSHETLSMLVTEVQEYGGHSIVNAWRKVFNTSLVSYEEIVTDVHKHLNLFNSKEKSLAVKEMEVVFSLFGEDWLIMTPKSRHERCISTKVLNGEFKPNSKRISAFMTVAGVTSLATFAVTRLVAPVAGVLVINSSLSEAYRITIPFVAQMGWIRLFNNEIC